MSRTKTPTPRPASAGSAAVNAMVARPALSAGCHGRTPCPLTNTPTRSAPHGAALSFGSPLSHCTFVARLLFHSTVDSLPRLPGEPTPASIGGTGDQPGDSDAGGRSSEDEVHGDRAGRDGSGAGVGDHPADGVGGERERRPRARRPRAPAQA